MIDAENNAVISDPLLLTNSDMYEQNDGLVNTGGYYTAHYSVPQQLETSSDYYTDTGIPDPLAPVDE